MSRRLVIGLFALIVAMATTIWTLVLVREEPPPPPPARAERPASPDATVDATAEEQRRAAEAASAAAGAPPTPPPATAPPPASDAAALPTPPLPATTEAPAATDAPATTQAPAKVEAPAVTEAPATADARPDPAKDDATKRDVAKEDVAKPDVARQDPPRPEAPKTEEIPKEQPREQETARVPAAPMVPAPVAPTPPPRDSAPLVLAPEGPPAHQAPTILVPRPPLVLAPDAPPADAPAVVLPRVPPAPAVVAAPPPPPPAPRRIAPSFDVVRVAVDGTAVIAGRAEAGALLQVFDGEREIGRTTADSRGEWVLLPAGALAPGTRELSLVSKGPGDVPEIRSERVVVVVVPERQQAAQWGGALAVSMPRDASGTEPSRALQVPSAGPRQAQPISLAVETVDYDGTGNVVLAGRCPPGGTVLVYLDGKVIGRVVADADGRWSLTPEGTVAPGVYTLRVDQLGADGRVAQRMEMPFSRAEPSAELAAAGADRIIVQPGNSLWRIARRVYGEGTRYSVIYQANREMIRDPDLIYPGQVFALPPGQTPAR